METDEGQQGGEPDVTGAGATFDLPPDPPADADGEGAGDQAQDQQPAKQTRQQRRAERGESYAAAARAAEARAQRAEESAQQTAREFAEWKGRMAERDAQTQRTAVDPDESALEAAQQRISQAVARMGGGDVNAEKEWHAAMREHARIVARQVAREEGAEMEKRVTGKIPTQMEPGLAALHADYPFLASNDAAKAVANGQVALLIATEKRDMRDPAVRMATLREGAAHAAKVLKLGGGRQAPTDLDRGRIAGAGGGDSGAGNETVRVHLDDAQKSMAEQLFRSEPKEKAWAKWWKEIGSKTQKK